MSAKYRFQARAVAVSGSLSRPVTHEVNELCKCELIGTEGGYHTNLLENHRYEEIYSFGAAYTQVTASEGPDGHFNTLATATIEKLNVLDVVKADRITARLVGYHCETDYHECPHPWIHPLGSTIENLQVAGRPYPIEHPPGFLMEDFEKPHRYEVWKQNKTNYESPGKTIHVPGFGDVTLFRLMVQPHQVEGRDKPCQLHKLVMLELKLGSPIAGTLSFAATDDDGSPP